MTDKRAMSRCGVYCRECEYFGEDCAGCAKIGGRAFWLRYTGGDVCDIYRCCNQHGYIHCGRCAHLPCEFFAEGDPTKTPAQNEATLRRQLENLRQGAKQKEP